MKKHQNITLIGALSLTLIACTGSGQGAYKDGTYRGEAAGYDEANPIEVEMRVEGGKIADIKVLKHGESVDKIPQAKEALETLPGAIAKKGSTDVDGVTGATATSNGIKGAVDKALEQAK